MGAANDALEAAYSSYSQDCSGLVKFAGPRIGYHLPPTDADGIIAELNQHRDDLKYEWQKIGGPNKPTCPDFQKPAIAVHILIDKAYGFAVNGRVVLLGAKHKDYGISHGHPTIHGHVAIMLPKRGGDYNLPYLFGGGDAPSHGKETDKTLFPMNYVFSRKKFDVLQFFVHRSARLGKYDF